MRLGIMIGSGNRPGLEGLIAEARQAGQAGLDSVWMSQIFGLDALTTLAVVGREVPAVQLGTAVVPTYPRHPMVMASQALTTQAATGGRFVLGVGLSHKIVIEDMLGYSFDRPVRHMTEYLSILVPLITQGSASFEGETMRWTGSLDIQDRAACPVLVAALGPRMLELAGRVADGTVTWMTGPATVASHIVPSIKIGADHAGRPAPRVAVALPTCVSDDADDAIGRAGDAFSIYGQLPSYRAMLDREGAAGPGDVALVGNEAAVEGQIEGLAEAGATDFIAVPFGRSEERARTMELLSTKARG